jgi:hypothetical protein
VPDASDIRIRHADGGLEVFTVTKKVRVGLRLRGAEVAPSEALSLFAERGRGKAKSYDERPLFPGTGEEEAAALMERLLAG